MFSFFEKKPWQLSGSEKMLLARSVLPGFQEFIQVGSHDTVFKYNDTHPSIKLINENEIPCLLYYFKYIGRGEIIQAVKYPPDHFSQKGSGLPVISKDAAERISDVNYEVNTGSPKWTRDELFPLFFQLSQMKQRWLKT